MTNAIRSRNTERRVLLIRSEEVNSARIEALVNTGAAGIALPLARTRMGIQTAVDAATKAGLEAWGWIEVGTHSESESGLAILDEIRRLVDGYPNLDGYLLAGVESRPPEFLRACREMVYPHQVVPAVAEANYLPAPPGRSVTIAGSGPSTVENGVVIILPAP